MCAMAFRKVGYDRLRAEFLPRHAGIERGAFMALFMGITEAGECLTVVVTEREWEANLALPEMIAEIVQERIGQATLCRL